MRKRIRITIEVDTKLPREVFNTLVAHAISVDSVFEGTVYLATELVETDKQAVIMNFKRKKRAKIGR